MSQRIVESEEALPCETTAADGVVSGQLPPPEEVAPSPPNIFGRLAGIFRPPVTEQRITAEIELNATYRYWRIRVLYTSILGYAVYYFVRKNIAVAMPAMEADLGVTKADLGLFLTLHGVVYGVSKFLNGILGDRANARSFMAVGLLLAAGMNFLFGMSSAVYALGLFWLLNGYFQGMGFPPCARVITHWFAPRERATVFSVWNTSHSLGAAGVLVLTSFLVQYDWRLCFYVPAALAVLVVFQILHGLRDTPAELGLPEVEDFRNERLEPAAADELAQPTDAEPTVAADSEESFNRFLRRQVFGNPLIWIVALANFFVYVVRYAILDWGPSFLKEARGVELGHTGLIVAFFEIGGVAGMLAGGVLTDRVFKSHAGRACVVYMACCAILVYLFWTLPVESKLANSALLAGIGFFIYGPQCLVGVIAANLSTKRAAATAIGLTGLFGYASTVLSGWGLGVIVDNYDWHRGFNVVVVCAAIATLMFVWLWNVSAETELKCRSH